MIIIIMIMIIIIIIIIIIKKYISVSALREESTLQWNGYSNLL